MYDIFSVSTRTLYLVTVSKKWICRFLYQFLTSEKLIIFLADQIWLSNLNFKYGLLMKRAANQTVVVICGAMYTEHWEYILRTKAIECIDNESLD